MNLRATEMTRLRLWTTSCSCARLSPLRARRVTLSSVSRSNGGWALISLISGARSSNSLRSRISLRSSLSPCAAYNARALPTIPDPWKTPEPPLVHRRFLDAQRTVLLLISFRGVMTHGSLSDAGHMVRNGAETLRTSPPSEFRPPVRGWFEASFASPTRAQVLGWPPILSGRSTLLLAPTGSGKTLAAFLTALDKLMFTPAPEKGARCRVLYVSPLKALAVDVERNLRAPLAGIAQAAGRRGDAYVAPTIAIRTGDTPQAERARFQREPADLLITTPESLYLLLTSNAREALRSIDTIIIDEIHALVPTKRGAHMALSLERLEAICERPPQRIGLSATQRPLDEVARFLGGAEDVGRPSRGRRTAAEDVGRPS